MRASSARASGLRCVIVPKSSRPISTTAPWPLRKPTITGCEAVIPATEAAAHPVELDKARLKEQAMKSEAVQAMLDVFAAEIRDAEEIQ